MVLIAVGVTGFVAPGFFLSKGNTACSGGPEKVAQAIVDGTNAKDLATLRALKCADAGRDIDQVIDGVSSAANAKLGPVEKVSDSEYKATVPLSVNGKAGTAIGTIAIAGDKWCWKLVSGQRSSSPTSRSSARTSPAGTPSTGDGAAVIKDFIDKINAKDKAGATSLVCSGSEDRTATYIEKATSSDSPAITATPTGSGATSAPSVAHTTARKPAASCSLTTPRARSAFPVSSSTGGQRHEGTVHHTACREGSLHDTLENRGVQRATEGTRL